MKESDGAKAIKQIARTNGVSIADVRREMEIAIDTSLYNPDPEIQAFWEPYIRNGQKPTPEEFILYMAKKVKSDNHFLTPSRLRRQPPHK